MSEVGFFWIVVGLALVSLGLTYVLFHFLKSFATGKSKTVGGTIQYGGALAGFVLIFGLLFGAFAKLRPETGVTTSISLAGKWSLELRTSRDHVLKGTATIRQRPKDPVLEMSGEVFGPKPVTFGSMLGVVRNREVYLIYENIEGERGLLRGHVTEDKPKSLLLVYTDLIGYDKNSDPMGTLLLTR
ncbi:MAG TPA: hypothetical protein VF381_12515 [Thermoanaerobaculia bacterium]